MALRGEKATEGVISLRQQSIKSQLTLNEERS